MKSASALYSSDSRARSFWVVLGGKAVGYLSALGLHLRCEAYLFSGSALHDPLEDPLEADSPFRALFCSIWLQLQAEYERCAPETWPKSLT